MKPYQVLTLLMVIVITAVYCSGPQSKTQTTYSSDSSKTVYLNQGWSADDRAEYY